MLPPSFSQFTEAGFASSAAGRSVEVSVRVILCFSLQAVNRIARIRNTPRSEIGYFNMSLLYEEKFLQSYKCNQNGMNSPVEERNAGLGYQTM
jgi:hypothetical protein